MRRRRHEIEYPRPGGMSDVTATEISQELGHAVEMVSAAGRLLDELDLF